MAQQTINVGTAPNDGTGTPLRTAFQYTNSNFTELYTATGPSGNNINVPGAATITGNLTVDTNTFFVDSANNRVGVGTATPADVLHVFAAAGGNILSEGNAGTFPQFISKVGSKQWSSGYRSGTTAFEIWEDSSQRYTIGNGGTPHTWYVGASTAMTLNSTGLGVGIVPSSFGRFSVQGTAVSAGILGMNTDATQCDIQSYNKPLAINRAGNNITMCEGSGNVGIGVAPSYKLHVNGRVSYSTGIGEGADLTLSSTGTQVQHGISSTWTSQNFYTGGTSRVVMKANGQVRFVPLASDPAGAEAGDVYYNSTSNKLKCYNGTTWNDLF